MDSIRPTTRIWQTPLRLYHWLLVICICGAFWTALVSHDLDLHINFGIGAGSLMIFRLLWFIAGRWPGRLFDLPLSPLSLFRYLKPLKGPKPPLATSTPGHNPLGVYSVIAMVAAISTQAFTGLTLTDDILFTGPLHDCFDTQRLAQFSELHHMGLPVLGGLIGLHLIAVVIHQIKGEPLLQKITTGHITPLPSAFPTKGGEGWAAAFWCAVIATVLTASIWFLPELKQLIEPYLN